MKHPFWIVNLGLLSLVLVAFAFAYISRVKVPRRESIEPSVVLPKKELKVAINIKKIYEDDIFGTYTKELPQLKRLEAVIPFPEPPMQERIVAPRIIEPEFLDPLQVTLKGIIVVGSNDAKNRAMVLDNKTTQEGTYKVGDIIQDAQLIRIFKNKIIFLRLNGQQEVLYLREQDAKVDPAYTENNEWDNVIKKITEYNYLINPKLFVEQVKNVTQFIDMLNATTAYQQGKSIGLRIGNLSKSPFGSLLGLQKGDIIINVNNIPAQTTEERLAIYKNVTSLKIGNKVTVNLIRRNTALTITYTLQDFSTVEKKETIAENQQTASFFDKKNDNFKQQHYAFAPTIDKIKRADHQMMFEKGNSPMHSSS